MGIIQKLVVVRHPALQLLSATLHLFGEKPPLKMLYPFAERMYIPFRSSESFDRVDFANLKGSGTALF